MKKATSKKAQAKKVQAIIEAQTFGMKNKNSKKNQKAIQQLQNNVANNFKFKKGNNNSQPSKKQIKAQRDQELKELGLFQEVERKSASTAQSQQQKSQQDQLVDQEKNCNSNNDVHDPKLMSLDDWIEEMRNKIGEMDPNSLTMVTPETFKVWKDKKKLEKERERLNKLNKREKDILSGQAKMTGRELFEHKRSVFVDDEKADDSLYVDDRDQSLVLGFEEQLKINAEVNNEVFDQEAIEKAKEQFLGSLKKERLERHNLQLKSRDQAQKDANGNASDLTKESQPSSKNEEPNETDAMIAMKNVKICDPSLFNEEDLEGLDEE